MKKFTCNIPPTHEPVLRALIESLGGECFAEQLREIPKESKPRVSYIEEKNIISRTAIFIMGKPAKIIQDLMVLCNLSMAAFADSIGYSQSHISNILGKNSGISMRLATAIAEKYIHVSDLREQKL